MVELNDLGWVPLDALYCLHAELVVQEGDVDLVYDPLRVERFAD